MRILGKGSRARMSCSIFLGHFMLVKFSWSRDTLPVESFQYFPWAVNKNGLIRNPADRSSFRELCWQPCGIHWHSGSAKGSPSV